MQHHERNTDDLKREIERTRARVAADVDAIGAKISPENVKQRMKQRVSEGVRQRMDTVKDSTRRAGRGLVTSARSNPMPLMLIGAGVGWLIYNARKDRVAPDGWREPGWDEIGAEESSGSSARERIHYARERAGERLQSVRQRASERYDQMSHRVAHARERAGERIVHYREGAEHFMTDNPLAVGALALAIGAGVGMLMPHTRFEDRALGERRDRLMERGRDKLRGVVEDAKEVAKDVASEAKSAAERGISDRGYDMSKGKTVPGGSQAPGSSGPNEEFDSTIERRT